MKWIIFGILLLGLLVLACILWERKHFQVTEYTFRDSRFSKNQEPVKTVVLADLHNQTFGKNNEKLLAAIDKIRPAYIFVAGDMPVARPGKTIEPAASFMEKLAEKYPICYGVGNHEYRMMLYPETYGDAYDRYNDRLLKCGVQMLHNEKMSIVLGEVPVDVYGLEMDRRYYKRFKKIIMDQKYLEEVLPKPDKEVFRILLAHSPDYFPAYAKWGADLTLSGHLHGGAVRMGKFGIISASTGLFPKYSGGRYTQNDKVMLVSRGLGAHTIPIRLFNRPELIVLNFKG